MKRLTFSLPIIAGSIFFIFLHVYEKYRRWDIGTCGHEYTTVVYRFKKDYRMACDGIDRAKQFFSEYGLSNEFPITIFFEHESDAKSDTYGDEQVLGYFDQTSSYIHLPSYVSRTFKRNKIYSFRDAAENNNDIVELFTSVIAHEVAHLLTFKNSEQRYNLLHVSTEIERMGNGVQEYVAGVVQINSMEESLRERVLKSLDQNLLFTNEQQINLLSYLSEPQQFLIMSYRHYYSLDAEGQKLTLERILSRELNPDQIFDNHMFALSD